MTLQSLPHPTTPSLPTVAPPPLLERLRRAALDRGDSRPTADTLVSWTRAYILFHDKRHPSELGLAAVTHFLEHVVRTAPEPLPALAQARAALTLLYAGVLGIDLGELPQPPPPRLLDQLGHESLETTMIYTHVARKGPAGVASPLDLLGDLTPASVEAAAAASLKLHGDALMGPLS